mmetsp:Transcript_27153/g.68191  ORF Transcript_27153/g.68191 Transcript_27153/m.68191 type:complete len:102 (+) Transcript_27153:1453-1758(+)
MLGGQPALDRSKDSRKYSRGKGHPHREDPVLVELRAYLKLEESAVPFALGDVDLGEESASEVGAQLRKGLHLELLTLEAGVDFPAPQGRALRLSCHAPFYA